MKNTLALLFLLLSLVAIPRMANAQASDSSSPWMLRCDQQETGKQCEMFQRLSVKETGQRVAEFAVGYPDGINQPARGVLLLPLGILLEEGGTIQVDDQKSFKFRVRYCTTDGCFAFVRFNDAVLGMLKRGNDLRVSFKTMQQRQMTVEMSLKGFTKSLGDVRNQ